MQTINARSCGVRQIPYPIGGFSSEDSPIPLSGFSVCICSKYSMTSDLILMKLKGAECILNN